MALDRMHEVVQQAWEALGLVLEVLAASGAKVPTVLVARVACTLATVEVRLILGVVGHFGLSEVSN